jgi:hypothetical protein
MAFKSIECSADQGSSTAGARRGGPVRASWPV